MEPWLGQVVRGASIGVLVVDPNDMAVLDGIEFILGTLEKWRAPAPRLLIANKMDLAGSRDNFTALKDLYGGRFGCLGISALTGENLDRFARAVFDALEIVRVYTKAPGKKAEFGTPFLVHRGGTVLDAARLVHKDFAENFKFARLFHTGGAHDGLMVERTHVVEDGDILEFHI
jgi:ribosome-interacting GTPase 1